MLYVPILPVSCPYPNYNRGDRRHARRISKYPLPEHVLLEIRDHASRDEQVKLPGDERGRVLTANDQALAEQIARSKQVAPWLGSRWSALEFGVAPAACGEIKQALPDRETVLRILGLAKGSAVALNDTVLEYKDPGKQRPWLIQKLKAMGVLVSVHENAKATSVHR